LLRIYRFDRQDGVVDKPNSSHFAFFAGVFL